MWRLVQMAPADFILQHKPAVVVFENSFSPAGGNGAVVSCDDKGSHDGSAAVTALCRLATEMSLSNPHQLQAGWQVRPFLDTQTLQPNAWPFTSIAVLLLLSFY